jgi:transposase
MFKKRLEAHKLRRKGLSILAISKRLKVAKSTTSNWCNGLKLTPEQKEHLLKNAIKAGLKGRLIGAEMNKKKK